MVELIGALNRIVAIILSLFIFLVLIPLSLLPTPDSHPAGQVMKVLMLVIVVVVGYSTTLFWRNAEQLKALKKKAWNIHIAVSIFFCLLMPDGSSIAYRNGWTIVLAFMVGIFLYLVWSVIYLTRPKVKEMFK